MDVLLNMKIKVNSLYIFLHLFFNLGKFIAQIIIKIRTCVWIVRYW